MLEKNIELTELLSFEYDLHHKVYGTAIPLETYEQFYEGFISKVFEPTYPATIGIFELMVYDLDKAKNFGHLVELMEIIDDSANELDDRFMNINKLMNNYDLDIKSKDKILFLKNVIIEPKWRGKGILVELIKSIYITQFTKNSILIVNSSPLQNIREELDFYKNECVIDAHDGYGKVNEVSISELFKLDKLPDVDEGHDYKLYAKMLKLNFKQFEDTDFFYIDNEDDFLKIFK